MSKHKPSQSLAERLIAQGHCSILKEDEFSKVYHFWRDDTHWLFNCEPGGKLLTVSRAHKCPENWPFPTELGPLNTYYKLRSRKILVSNHAIGRVIEHGNRSFGPREALLMIGHAIVNGDRLKLSKGAKVKKLALHNMISAQHITDGHWVVVVCRNVITTAYPDLHHTNGNIPNSFAEHLTNIESSTSE